MKRSSALIALASLAILLAGCGFKRRHSCQASITYAGKTAVGEGTDFNDPAEATARAKANICKTYCRQQDPVVEAAMRSLPGGVPANKYERDSAAEQPSVKPLTQACEATCTTATATATPQVTCGTVGFLLGSLAGARPR